MKGKAKDGGKSKSEPFPEYSDVLTLSERQELSDLWEAADAALTTEERERERALTSRLGPGEIWNDQEHKDLAAIKAKAQEGRDKVLVRMAWMVFAKSADWQHLKRLAVWRLSNACWWVDGKMLGRLAPEGGWIIPHRMDREIVGPRLIWDCSVAAITAKQLWATPNGTVRVSQEFALGGGWNSRVETRRDYDVKPAEFLSLLSKRGFYLVPDLAALIPTSIAEGGSDGKPDDAKPHQHAKLKKWFDEHSKKERDANEDKVNILKLAQQAIGADVTKLAESRVRDYFSTWTDAASRRKPGRPPDN